MKKQWFFDRYCGQQFAALLEDGNLAEFAVEMEENGDVVGNVYKGVVTNVLSGMNAAFISCGLEKNCYLSMEETYTDYTKYDGTPVSTNTKPLSLQIGDELIVQVTKPPRGNKGAKVTTHLSFVGRRLIYLPRTDFLGISRKITDDTQRETLLKIADAMREGNTNEGFIIRTQAPYATQQQLQKEANYLKKLYAEMCRRAENAPVGTVLYQDEELPVRTLRDTFGDDVSIYVGDEELYQKLRALIRLRDDIPEENLIKHNGDRSMMRQYGISPLVYEAVNPRVPLHNGGYLVIDHTEAMTVIDVNTGSYIGKDNLEDTVFSVNLEAAKEIARQVRLRNIGGIVVVDFIDMVEESHRDAVTQTLESYLAADRAKCKILPMSEFCITQFTRKQVGLPVLSFMVKGCSHCAGIGYVHEDIFVLTRLRADLLDCFADGHEAALIELNENIYQKIVQKKTFAKELVGRWKNKRLYFVPHKTYPEDYFTIRGEKDAFPNLPDRAQLLKY
ncbi:MAG: Rne/Rng family ribonuclease [Clostridiales bacterium]|nr:Rne/Rng family ribonuclease [Clostridiales bacterium]